MSVLSDLFSKMSSGWTVGVTVTTNQHGGVSSYATGVLGYEPGGIIGPVLRPPRVTTAGREPLQYLFSDRLVDLPSEPPSQFVLSQPFSIRSADKLGLSITRPFFANAPATAATAKFTLVSWGNATFTVSLQEMGDTLVGVGPPVGNSEAHAVYVIAFAQPQAPPH